MFKTILAATDGSDHADKAVGLASDLAAKYDAKLILLHVLLSGDRADQLRHWAEIENIVPARSGSIATALAEIPMAKAPAPGDGTEFLAQRASEQVGEHLTKACARLAREKGAKTVETVVAEGDPAKCILETAKKEGADLIVLGSRGLGDLKGLLLGSVSHKVSHLADCTCITVR
ncbi:MAG: universal stress protein [Alphaproteobacteria bacterium]|nr:universal stress protein [Alphaproteobacteria bacterium]